MIPRGAFTRAGCVRVPKWQTLIYFLANDIARVAVDLNGHVVIDIGIVAMVRALQEQPRVAELRKRYFALGTGEVAGIASAPAVALSD